MSTYPSNPHAEEKPSRLSRAAVVRLLGLARAHAPALAAAGVLTLISTVISLSIPLLLRAALDQVLRTRQIGALDRLALGVMGLILLSTAITFVEYLLLSYTGNRIVMELRQRLFAHLQRLPVAFFDRNRSGDLTSRLSNDVGQLQQTLTDDIVRLVGNVVTLAGGIALAVIIDWRLTAVVLALLTALLSTFIVFGRRVRKLARETLDALADTMGTMTEALANIRLVKAFAREEHEDKRASDKLGTTFRLAMRASSFEMALWSVAGTGFMLVLLGVMWYGGRSVLLGSISAGSLAAFLMTVYIISGPMASLGSLYGRLQRSIGAADRLFAILDDRPEDPDQPDAVAFPNGPGGVTFERVYFSYTGETPVLSDLSLDVPPGKVTALVGASGAGKTTLALLLYRFYEPQQGTIRIDGVPVRQIIRRDLREQIGLVPQESILFNGTIRENIRYGRLDATDAEVEAAARAANVEEFVSGLPDGYETMLGERGITLSGGQRQRVAIARALLKDPRILVLDEATSALDTRSEALVRDALDRLMRGRTTIVIAHRLTTVQNADQIAVIDQGRVVERGTHEELMREEGVYARLHSIAREGLLEEAVVIAEAPTL